MTVGKAIYYLLSNYSDLTDIVSTRIYPEVAEQDAAMPFVIYTVVSNEPSDTQSSPSQLDIAQVDIVLFSTDYSQVVDMGVAARAALDRVTGTYNGVNVQSCQYTSEVIDFEEYPRAYVITQSYDVRINRDEFEIARAHRSAALNIIDLADTPGNYGTTGQALVVNADGDGMEWGETASDLGDLTNVTLDDPQDREALVYDEDTDTWINGASTKLAIRVINQTGATLYAATPVKASGVQGDQVSVTLYRATEDAKLFIGLLDADIPNGGTGYARQTGTIYNLNTLAFTVGQILYPAQAAAGLDNGLDYMTATVPGSSSAIPVAKIPAAIVLRQHVNTGRVYVRTWSPDSKLEELANVFAPIKNVGDTIRWNGTQWASGAFVQPTLAELSDVANYNPATLQDKTSIRWDAVNLQWAMVPATGGLPDVITYFLNRYDAEANTARQEADATLIIERYVTVQADGHGEKTAAQGSTPSEGNKLVRKIWHKATAFEDSDVTTWTLAHTFADNTAYIDTIDTFQELLAAATYGSIPLTLAQTWENVPALETLLDIAPGAAVAFSAARLVGDSSTYTGDLIRVRRASDSAEQDIGFDGDGLLDTSALATFCAGTDGFITTWYDQSGNGNDPVQVTTSAQPKIYDATEGYLTGLKFVPASNTHLSLAYTFDMTDVSAALVAKADNTGNYAIIDAHETTAAREFVMGVNNGTVASTIIYDGNQTNDSDTLSNYDDLFLLTMFADSSTANDSYLNGQACTGTTSPPATPNTTNNIRIGQRATGSADFSGLIFEFVVWFSDQSANRAAIEANINAFYSIY
jgi:hypothetical protein